MKRRSPSCNVLLAFTATALAACEPRPPTPKTADSRAGIPVFVPAAQARDENQTNRQQRHLQADAPYRVDIATSEGRDGSLRIEPRVSGPAGKTVRYEVEIDRGSRGAKANSSQSGSVRLDDAGMAQISSNAVKLNPGERYEMKVRLFEGDRLVAEQLQEGRSFIAAGAGSAAAAP